MGSEGREVTGVAGRFTFQQGLAVLGGANTPMTISTGSVKIWHINLQMPLGAASPVKLTSGDGNTVFMRVKVPASGHIVIDIPFLADTGLQISVDSDNGGSNGTAAFTNVLVYHSHTGA